jgi:hypothetical protein
MCSFDDAEVIVLVEEAAQGVEAEAAVEAGSETGGATVPARAADVDTLVTIAVLLEIVLEKVIDANGTNHRSLSFVDVALLRPLDSALTTTAKQGMLLLLFLATLVNHCSRSAPVHRRSWHACCAGRTCASPFESLPYLPHGLTTSTTQMPSALTHGHRCGIPEATDTTIGAGVSRRSPRTGPYALAACL